MKKIIVAGGAGFVGSFLCERLLNEGNRVICIDNLITGSKANIEAIISSDNFSFLETDICSPDFLKNFKEKNISEIYNLASPASPVDYFELPLETMKVGSIGVFNLLELAKVNNARILVASTSEIYGDPLKHPQDEEYWGNVNPIGPRSCYDEAKRFMEAAVAAYKSKYGLETRIVRIFNTYGPRMRLNDGRVVPNFISQALQGNDITIYGDGTQTRSFCFVDDLVEGIIRLMASDVDSPVNIGNPDEKSIIEFAKIIIETVASKSSLKYCPPSPDDPRKRRPDITKARTLLKWEPGVSLKEGLIKTVEYFQKRLDV